jgi:hypothetical protein
MSQTRPKPPERSSALRQTADHESAHALVASKLGIEVYATIVACDEMRALGTTAPVPLPSEIDPATLLAMCVAGIVGELVRNLTPNTNHFKVDSESANKVVWEVMGIAAGTPQESAAFEAARKTAHDILVEGESDRQAIADALLTYGVVHVGADGTVTPYEGNEFERRCLLRNLYGVRLA